MQRFYRLDIQTDLFGNQCLIREWGRIGRGGQIRSILCRTEEEAQAKQPALLPQSGKFISSVKQKKKEDMLRNVMRRQW